MSTPLPRMIALLSALESASIRHCHFKSNAHLSEALAGETDYDLLVDRAASAEVERLLSAHGFKRVLSQPWARFPGVEDWIGFDEDRAALMHVHLHFTLITGTRHVKEQRVPWEVEILASTILDPEHQVRVTDPRLELLLLLIRLIFKTPKGEAPPRHIREELAWLQGRADLAGLQGIAARLLPSVRAIDLELGGDLTVGLDRLRAPILRDLRLYQRFTAAEAQARRRLNRARFQAARVARKLKRPTQWGKRLHSGGRLIAVIGCDGAGKSTITQDLKRWLAWKLDADTVYLGVGDGNISPSTWALKRLSLAVERRRGGGGVSAPSTTGAKRSKLKPQALLAQGVKDLGVGALNLAFAHERIKKIKAAEALRRDGLILLTDRFPQIQVRGIYDGPRTQRKARATPIRAALADKEEALFEAMTGIKPDLIIRLKITVDVALARKPEHREPEMRRKVAITDELEFPGVRVVDIDATQPLEAVIAQARRAVWAAL